MHDFCFILLPLYHVLAPVVLRSLPKRRHIRRLQGRFLVAACLVQFPNLSFHPAGVLYPFRLGALGLCDRRASSTDRHVCYGDTNISVTRTYSDTTGREYGETVR